MKQLRTAGNFNNDGNHIFNEAICEKNTGNQNDLTEKEQLEEACWNGLLLPMIPEIYDLSEENKKLFLWQIKKGQFIHRA